MVLRDSPRRAGAMSRPQVVALERREAVAVGEVEVDRGHGDLARRDGREVGAGLVALVGRVAVDPVQAPAARVLLDQRHSSR